MRALVIMLCIYAFLIGAWVVNIYKFATLDFETPYKAEILRGVGIPVAPLGIVLAFIEFEEEKGEKMNENDYVKRTQSSH